MGAAHEEIITSVDVSLSGLGFPSFPKGATPLDLDYLTPPLPLRRAPDPPTPLIRFEELSRISFPALLPPLAIPAMEKKPELSPAAKALLAPVPWKPVATARKRRRWPKLFLAAVLGTLTGWALFQTPLAQDPRVRPYAEVVNAKTTRGWVIAKAGTMRGAAWVTATWNRYVR